MNAEELYWETLITARPMQRKMFQGWSRAVRDAAWWMETGSDVYITNYGFRKTIADARMFGYDRDEVPDYNSAVIEHLFIDLDYFIKDEGKIVACNWPIISQDVLKVDRWCEDQDIKRRWNFTGGGFHGFVAAEGPANKVDDALYFLAAETGAKIDPGSNNLATSKRVINSKNNKYGNRVIPVTMDEVRRCTREELLELAKEPRQPILATGKHPWYFADVKASPNRPIVLLGQYSRQVTAEEKNVVLDRYGLDWNVDFCPAMQHLIMQAHPSNSDRMLILKYIFDVLKVPFVDCIDKTKTVGNLLFNLLENKEKARHAIKMREPEAIYKRERRFHPYKLRLQGLCPEDCARCLETRNN